MASQARNVYQMKGRNSMPSKNGFITVWRDIQKQPWYKSPEHVAIFLHILTSASHQARTVDYRGLSVNLLQGQFITTYKKLAETFGIESESKVRRIIAKFIKLGQVSKLNLKKGRTDIALILTIRNWEKWQKTDTPSDTPSDTHADTPNVAYLKASKGSADTPSDTPSDTHADTLNNNDINNNLVSKDTCQNSGEFSHVDASPKPVKQDHTPYAKIIDLYHEILPMFNNVRQYESLKANIKQRHFKLKTLEGWERYFNYIKTNCTWMYSGDYGNASKLAYIVNKSNFEDIVNGGKDDRN